MISVEALRRVHELWLPDRPNEPKAPWLNDDELLEEPAVWGHPGFEQGAWLQPRRAERIDPLSCHPATQLTVANEELGDQPPNWPEIESRLPEVGLYGRLHDPRYDGDLEPTELLAWYRPFHFAPQERWGIYFREVGIFKVARALSSAPPKGSSSTLNELLAQAKMLLHLHEAFHHITEVAATAIEFIESDSGRPSRQSRYLSYFHQDYLRHLLGPDKRQPLEEALANAYAYNRLTRGLKGRAAAFMGSQPSGYSDFARYKGEHTRFRAGLSDLHGRLRGQPGGIASPMESLFDLAPLPTVTQGVPTYLIREVADPDYALGFSTRFSFDKQVRDQSLEKDLKNKSDWARSVERFQTKLDAGTTPGVDFEWMCRDLFRAKLDDGLRLILETAGSKVHLKRALNHKHYERYRKRVCR